MRMLTNEVLFQKAELVTDPKEALSIIRTLENAMMGLPSCIGLAANQVGIAKSVSVIRHPEGGSIDLINPVIVEVKNPFISKGEGCMSYPGRVFDVPRFGYIKVEYDAIWADAPMFNDPEFIRRGTKPTPDDLPDGVRLVKREGIFVYNQSLSSLGGIICVAIQHECDHLAGITVVTKEGATEVVYSQEGIKRQFSKVGRNEPCPCGSGKKYKKCCWE